jgi:hypothetical protein
MAAYSGPFELPFSQVALTGGVSITQTVVALTAGADATLIAANPKRRFLAVANIGTNPATLAFDVAAVAGQGWPLAAGASFPWDGASVPTNALHAISTAGSTVVVLEGV